MDNEHKIGNLQGLYKVYKRRLLSRPTLNVSREGCLSRFLRLPVVYASEMEENESQTTLDKLANSRPTVVVSDTDIVNYLSKETGKDRLREMFTLKENNEPHVELGVVINAMKGGFIAMTFIGWLMGSKMARERFLEKAMHKKYETKFRALRAQNDAIFIGGAKNGLKWGLKTATFIGIFMLVSQTISFYRNKSSPLEYAAGGVVTGSLFRLNMGLRGMVGGGFLGGVLGAVGGLIIYTSMNLASDKTEDRHYRRIEEMIRNQRSIERVKLPSTEPETKGTNAGLPS